MDWELVKRIVFEGVDVRILIVGINSKEEQVAGSDQTPSKV
jgi:hypothetical protein